MRRPSLVVAAVCVLGASVVGMAQLSGTWETRIHVLPAPLALDFTRLELTYTVDGGWAITSTSTFTGAGFTGQSFGLWGLLGPVEVLGGMDFNPADLGPVTVTFPEACDDDPAEVTLTPPAYMSAWGKATLELLGASFTAGLTHYAYPYAPDYAWPCCADEIESYMLYSFTGASQHFGLVGRFHDCCAGITFKDALLALSDLSLCCGLTHTLELAFAKSGFQYFLITADSLFPLCCGITFDLSIKFTVDAKEVSLTPKFVGFAEFCVTVYADLDWDGGKFQFDSLVIHGFKLSCSWGDCSGALFATAFSADDVKTGTFSDGLLWAGYVPGPPELLFDQFGTWVVEPAEPTIDPLDPLLEGGIQYEEGTYISYELTGIRTAHVPAELGLQAGAAGTVHVKIGDHTDPDPAFVTFGDVPVEWHASVAFDQYRWQEFETAQLSFCGAACCGEIYSVTVGLFWADFMMFDTYEISDWEQDDEDNWYRHVDVAYMDINPTLFGLSRFLIEASIPLLAGFALEVGFSHTLFTTVTTMTFGWTFTF